MRTLRLSIRSIRTRILSYTLKNMAALVEPTAVTSLSAPEWLTFEPVGRSYCNHVINLMRGLDARDDHMRQQSEESGTSDEEVEEEDEELNQLLLDPGQWKEQDHYSLLGLGKVRYRASPKEIRKSYQQKVLVHHPDKQTSKEDTHFKCIQIAYEILSNPRRKRAYDSVDPTFDDGVPPPSANSRENFFDVFGPVFEENARWSIHNPVPKLGGADATLEEVDEFYKFWYGFSSWREFSFLDEENLEKAENREERRWMDKQNKTVRVKRKKEESARIRTLVDNAYSCDPRIKRFKDKEREEKEAQRKMKEDLQKQKALKQKMEQQQKEEEDRMRREKEEEEERQRAAQLKQEREMAKKMLKKERKTLRAVCKERGYYAEGEKELVDRMQQLELLCNSLTAENLQGLHVKLLSLSVAEGRQVFETELAEVKRRKEEEEEEGRRQAQERAKIAAAQQEGKATSWTHEEAQLLIKAVKLYPAGTVRRWEVIATFINTHSGSPESKTSQQVISKVKSLKKMDVEQKAVENKQAFSVFEQKHSKGASVEAPPTTRDVADVAKPWTPEEQKQLELALRTIPQNAPQRWDKISAMVTSRTKQECIVRFKELVAQVKAKKQAKQ